MSGDIRWYVQKNGKASGPFSFSDLKEQIKQGSLLGHDLVFKEGTNEWKKAFDWSEVSEAISMEQKTSFTALFTLPTDHGQGGEQWVILIKHQEGKSLRFEQDGPFDTEKVREFLKVGRLKPSDHIWKKGFPQWVAVSSRPEFSSSLWNVKDESVPLLQSVVEAPAPEAKIPKETKPAEAISLQEQKVALPPQKLEGKPAEAVVEKIVEKPTVVAKPVVPQPIATPVSIQTPAAKPEPIARAATLPKAPAQFDFPDSPKDEFDNSNPSFTHSMTKSKRFAKAPSENSEVSEVSRTGMVPERRPFSFPLKGKEWVMASFTILAFVAVFPMIRSAIVGAPEPVEQEKLPGQKEQASSHPEVSPDKYLREPEASPAAPTMDLPPSEAPVAAALPAAPAPATPQSMTAAKIANRVQQPAVTENKPAKSQPVVNAKPVAKPAAADRNISWSFPVPAEPGSSLYVVISGVSGQVLDVPALTLKLNLFMPESRKLQLEPRALKLPEGQYNVHVLQNGKTLLKGEREYVVDADRFDRKLSAHRKQIAYEQQQEKRALLKALDGLQRFLVTNSKDVANRPKSQQARTALRKKFEALGRPEVKKLRQQRHSLMYPSGWAAYSAQYENIQDLLEGGGPRNPAGRPDLDVLKKKIAQARTQVSQTSLWSKD